MPQIEPHKIRLESRCPSYEYGVSWLLRFRPDTFLAGSILRLRLAAIAPPGKRRMGLEDNHS
jgi:hypothetical protein